MESLKDKITKITKNDIKNYEELINNMVHPDTLDTKVDGNDITIKFGKNRSSWNENYTDYEIIKLKLAKDNKYEVVITSISGTHAVSHSKGVGYAGCDRDKWTMSKTEFYKYLDRMLDGLYKYNEWR